MNGASMNVVAKNRELLRNLFPSVFTETLDPEGNAVESINFERLKAEIGVFSDLFEARRERYGLDWPGKKEALRLIQQPTYAALRPKVAESVSWETTKNLFVEGDNLEVLKLLQKAYYGKVRLVHIDPPYNTDGDFIYPDNFTENLQTYLEYTGQVDGSGKKFSTVTEEDGRYHSRWLNMMWPRLYLARNLLADDGVILIHIDEHESENLRLVMSEIFGAENDLGEIIWDKKNPKGDSTKVASQHETIVAFAKNAAYLKEAREIKRPKVNAEKMISKAAQLVRKIGRVSIPTDLEEAAEKYRLEIDTKKFAKTYTLDDARTDYREWLSTQDVSGGEAAYKYIDDDGEIYRTVSMAWPNKKMAPDEYFQPLIHPFTKKPCPVPDRGWRNPPATMKELLKAGRIIFGEDEAKQPERKYLLKENMDENVPSVLPFGGSDDALLKKLGIPFDNPKPVDFVKSIISQFSGGSGIVLDFFAGSATVGHACMQLQADGADIEFVLVQLPEKLDPKRSEHKLGVQFCKRLGVPENIAEIAKERLRRASNAISKEKDCEAPGFRSFSLGPSAFRRWQRLSVESTEQQITEQLELHVEHVAPSASDEDLLFEVLIKAGFSPIEKVDTSEMAGLPVYSVAEGTLLICLAQRITRELVNAVAKAEPLQFVCLDTAFSGNDQLKANAMHTFAARKQGHEKTSRTVFRTV
ncbi:site-specific DNA-methyltransferase [Burkholderia sp. LMG 21824]|uniref:site-specific DNA-methyltransferase n=1 Tax=Burkholderia sp. LMG 21824 TaxID=3158172 RepID=UPI003C2EC933